MDNFIDEKDLDKLIEDGHLTPAEDRPPIVPGAGMHKDSPSSGPYPVPCCGIVVPSGTVPVSTDEGSASYMLATGLGSALPSGTFSEKEPYEIRVVLDSNSRGDCCICSESYRDR